MNQFAVATVSMMHPLAKRKDLLCTVVTKHWDEWHTRQATELREVSASPLWVQEELQGRFLSTLAGAWLDWMKPVVLNKLEYVCPSTVQQLEAYPGEDYDDTEDEVAVMHVRFTAALHYYRLIRMAWFLLGVSTRSVAFTQAGPWADAEIQYLRATWDNHHEIVRQADAHVDLDKLIERAP